MILCSFLASAFAVESSSSFSLGGMAGAETYESIHSSGVLKLNGTTVRNQLHVTGSLLAQSANIGSLEVLGETNLTNSTIHHASDITGHLRSVGCDFEGPIALHAHKAVFTATKIVSIYMKKQEAFKGKQIIELKQGSTVQGDIKFESGKGEVHLYPKSKVFGAIEGGKLIRKQ